MTEHEAYLSQARSDWAVFNLLLEQDREEVPACHPLHYLQMATEKLAKAVMIYTNPNSVDRYSHVAFSLLPSILSRRDVSRKLGRDFAAFKDFLRRHKDIFRSIDELNPSVGTQQFGGGPKEGPNAEYPWRERDDGGMITWRAPATASFRIAKRLLSGGEVRQFITQLIEAFEVVFS